MKESWGVQDIKRTQSGTTQAVLPSDNAYHTPLRVLGVPATLTGPPEMGEEGTVPAQPHHNDSLWSRRRFHLLLMAPSQPTVAQLWDVPRRTLFLC